MTAAILSLCPCMSSTVLAAPGMDQVGKATVNAVGSYAMTPIAGTEIPDGTYEIEVESSSSFFRIEKVELTVEDGEMTALLWMYTSSYSHVYMGTSEEAAAAEASDYIESEEIDYYDTFTIPVEALNQPIDIAAFSKKKQKWYYRQLVFLASSLPEGTLGYDLPDYDLINEALDAYGEENPEAAAVFAGETGEAAESAEADSTDAEEPEGMTIDMADGDYSIEVALAGGSGRANVTSPTWFYVQDGQAYAKLLWSSSYYDYMIIQGKRYENETTDGSNSTFTIPVTEMDAPMTVIADTTAMGEPLEIEYTLTFYRESVGSKSAVPQEGAKRVVAIAVVFMIVGGIINHFVKKRRGQ